MEQFKPAKREVQDGRVEGSERNRTMVAAAMFLGAMAAEPAFAQDTAPIEQPRAATEQRVDPGALLGSFINDVRKDLKAKGVDKQLESAAMDFLQSVTDQGVSHLQKVQEDLRKRREGN
jgi:hypothetical protein